MKLPCVHLSDINTRVYTDDTLYQSWHKDLNLAQQSILIEAGILPFLKTVTYRSNNPLCTAVINFIVDGQLTVGQSKLQITEEEIHEATRLPNSGRDVTTSTDCNGNEIIVSLTSQTDASRLIMNDIIDPVVQFASKFLVYKVLGYTKKSDSIPFKYVKTAIEVAQGVRFNWCKFIKDKMLQQIEVIQREHKGVFTYPTVLQFLALKAFNRNYIPRSSIGEGEASINAYNCCGKNATNSTKEKEIIDEGLMCIVADIMNEHKYRIITESPKKTEKNTNQRKRKTKGKTPQKNVHKSVPELASSSKSHTDEMSNTLPGLSNDIKESDGVNSMLLASPQPSESECTGPFDKKLKCSDNTTKEKSSQQVEDLKAIESKGMGSKADLAAVSVKQEMEVCGKTQEQDKDCDKELHNLRIENSQLLNEKLQWELERAMLEAQKDQLIDEKALVLQENEQLEIENSNLRAKLLENVQLSAELQRKLTKMEKFWGCSA
ncbi:uncharacterized protein LOC131032589 [Cryptomeria japonica]|uniref:uncharacterized protein LOC131032589 n=1 Tax=Cryptomeria japonica TaxID=3369 RepID=UPI0027DA7E73|nr:uncharacterized protein LOC131032589 [Cryptomeria japonica]